MGHGEIEIATADPVTDHGIAVHAIDIVRVCQLRCLAKYPASQRISGSDKYYYYGQPRELTGQDGMRNHGRAG